MLKSTGKEYGGWGGKEDRKFDVGADVLWVNPLDF